MEVEKYLDQILNDFTKVIARELPRRWIDNWGYSGQSMHAVLNQKNSVYQGGPYFYEGELKFVHWTSISNLMSIINNREVRFYNLHNSTDESELKFAANEMGVSELQIKHSKDHLYIFSFCEVSEKTNDHLWSEYGNNYSGAAIEFDIVNDPIDYHNFMLSQVYYDLPHELLSLVKKIEDLKSKFPGMTAELNLSPLISFHKKTNFKEEREVRLSTYVPFRDIEEKLTFTNDDIRIDSNGPRATNYFGLKLWVNNESSSIKNDFSKYDRRLIVSDEYFKLNPKIKITNVTLGENCGISLSKYGQFKQVIENAVRDKLGYKIEMPHNLFVKA